MEPLDRSRRFCHENFTPGRVYKLEPIFERDPRVEGHQFAFIKEAFDNLPAEFSWIKNPNQLRKYLLIKRGFCDAETTVFGSEEEALRFAARLKRMDERLRDWSLVKVDGAVVTQFVAVSQKRKDCPPARFREQKKAILEEAEHMLGVEKGALEHNAGRAA